MTAPLTLSTPPASAPAKIGRRISTDEGDPGFEPWTQMMTEGKAVRVLLNGQEIRNAVTADETEGVVVYLVVGLNGVPMKSPDGQPRRFARRGAIRIVVD